MKKLIRKLVSPRTTSGIFFVTFSCNSRCKHCFYWKSLNQKDIPLKDIEKIALRLPKFDSILLSGGEPFLRKDLIHIVDLLIKNNSISSLGIPTNGINWEEIIKKTKEILVRFPKLSLEINCSLDGLEEEHDFIRGVPGNFKKTTRLIEELNSLKKDHSNLRVTINTVITNRNYLILRDLSEYVKKLKVDNHTFDILRGDHSKLLSLPYFEELRKANRIRYSIRRYYNAKRGIIEGTLLNLRDKYVILLQQDTLKKKKWPFKCIAGKDHLVIEPNGNIRICELQPSIGNLLTSDLNSLLKSDKANKIFNQIEKHQCDCSHVCYLTASLNKHRYKILFKIPYIISKRI
jgi:MoaA/NifB/PqqE/SkfB family radical SAM enzyme